MLSNQDPGAARSGVARFFDANHLSVEQLGRLFHQRMLFNLSPQLPLRADGSLRFLYTPGIPSDFELKGDFLARNPLNRLFEARATLRIFAKRFVRSISGGEGNYQGIWRRNCYGTGPSSKVSGHISKIVKHLPPDLGNGLGIQFDLWPTRHLGF